MPDEAIPEELVEFLQAVAEDDGLRTWLLALYQLPPEARSEELSDMAERMRAGDEDPAIISAVSALARPAIYEGAYKTLTELRES